MLRKILLFTSLFPLWILSGCSATFQGSPAILPDSQNALKQLDPYYASVMKEYYGNNRDKKELRNEFIETRLAVIDDQYLCFKQRLYIESVSSNLGVDTAVLGLNLAGTLTPAASAKAILAAVSGGLIGTRAAAEKELYFEKTMPALLSQMEALRKNVRADIIKNMQLEVDSYPLSQAEYDLQQYYVAGTIPGAIVGITTEAVHAENQATALMADTIKSNLEAKGYKVSPYQKDDAGDILHEFVFPGGKPNDDNLKKLQSWMTENHIPGSPLVFIRSKDYASQRISAVDYLTSHGYIKK